VNRSSVKRLLPCALGILAGLALGLGYGHMRLQSEQGAHQARVREMTQRLSQAQRKYAQAEALQTTLEDEQQGAMARAEEVRKERERLLSENKVLKSRADALEAQAASLEKKHALSEAKAASLESKNGRLAERLAGVEADRSALDRKDRQTFQTLQDREKELKQESRKYDQCAEHNARLYAIGEELIRKYRDKGVVKALLQKEPLTQIERVEFEKLAQDYKDKIDQQRMPSK